MNMNFTIATEVNEVGLYNGVLSVFSGDDQIIKVITDCPNEDVAHSEALMLGLYYLDEKRKIQKQKELNERKNSLLLYGNVIHMHDWRVDEGAMRIYTVDKDDQRFSILMRNGEVMDISNN